MIVRRASAIVRLVLMAALFVASLGMVPTLSAQPQTAVHHAMAEEHSEPQGCHGDRDPLPGAPVEAVAHSCPGCAVVGEPPLIAAKTRRIPLPRLPADPLRPASLDTSPTPPPPRAR